MKKVISLVFLLAFLLASTATCFASTQEQSEQAEEGLYDYDTGMYYVNGELQRSRKTEYVGGGTWKHVVLAASVSSHYYHKSKYHSASTKNSRMAKARRIYANAGNWAKNDIAATISGNKVAWNTY